MKQLFLLRHAKAVPASSDVEDRDRPLSPRGRAGAFRVGRYLSENFAVPQRVLCSPALRTVETWGQVAACFAAGAAEIEYVPALYLASAHTIAALVRAVSDETVRLLIIGHNPGVEALAVALARDSGDDEERERHRALRQKFPTGAAAVLEFDATHWRAIATRGGRLAAFVRPKDL